MQTSTQQDKEKLTAARGAAEAESPERRKEIKGGGSAKRTADGGEKEEGDGKTQGKTRKKAGKSTESPRRREEHIMEVGQSIPYLLSKETSMHLERFDLHRLERRIREVVLELVQPLQYDQKDVLTVHSDLRHRQLLLEQKVKESVTRLDRGYAQIAAFGQFDKNVIALEKAQKAFSEQTEAQLLRRLKEVQEVRTDVARLATQQQTLHADVGRALRLKSVDMDLLSDLIS